MLQRMLGRAVNIIVSGDPLAHQVEHVLGARGLANPRAEEQGRVVEGRYSFLCTGDNEAFRSLGTRFLQLPLNDVEPLTLAPSELVAGAGR
jgi:glutamate racemase